MLRATDEHEMHPEDQVVDDDICPPAKAEIKDFHSRGQIPKAQNLDLDLDSFIKRAKRASSEWRSGRYLHLELPKPCELRGRI